MRSSRVLVLFCLAFVSFSSLRNFAQTAASPRIVERVDDNQLVTLNGNTLPIANPKNDLGPIAPNLPLTDLVLVLSRTPEQQAAFDAFVASQYDSTSSNFHQWLQPADIGQKFGPSLADIDAITNWLAGRGLSVAEVSKDRMSIRFNGTATQVQNAFHTQLHYIQADGQKHLANMSDPQIPAALAPVVLGVKALHDFRPRPLHRLGNKVQFDSSTGAWKRVPASSSAAPATGSSGVRPDFGISVSTQSGSYPVEDVTPYDFATIYNVLPLWNSGTPIDGTGQTIAIAATSDINPNDVANYRQLFGLPAGPPLNTIIANGVDPGQCTNSYGTCTLGDLYENTLDVEVSGGVAKNAQIDLVVSGNASPTTDPVYSSASYVIQNNTARILNVSYGLCELFLGTSGNAAWNNLWETGAAEGIGVFVASGDSGSPACDQGLDTSLPYGAQEGLAVSGLASSPYVTAVGGTDFTWCKPTITSSGSVTGCSTTSPWWNSTNSANGSSAANYLPEVPWNDSCSSPQALAYLKSLASFVKYSGVSDAETACNFVVKDNSALQQQYGIDLSFFVDSVGGGGGASNCTTNSTTSSTTNPDPTSCSGGYPKPTWQTGVAGISAGSKRTIPDVSFFAGNGLWDSSTLICVSQLGACVSSTSINYEPVYQEIGGTSVASPEMAGVMALINQKTGAPQGNANAELYALAAKQSYSGCSSESVKASSSCYFNDIDIGNNATPCQAGALNCNVAHSGDTWGILSGFNAGLGYDQATGLGSLNVANVVNAWKSVLGTAAATITITPSLTSLSIDQPLTVNVSVAGSGTTPSGNVGLVGGGYTGTAGTLSTGSYSFSIPAWSLAAGSDTLTISYSGDSNYAETTNTAAVTVKKVAPTITVQASPSPVGANTTLNVTVTVSASGRTPTGTVNLSGAGFNLSPCTLANGVCTFSSPSNLLTSGNQTLTASYSGDDDFTSGTATTPLTVNTLTPTVIVIPAVTTLKSTDSLQVTVKVTGTGATPTGSVILYGPFGGYQYYGTGLSGTLAGGTATITIPPLNLYGGTDALTASYQGDTLYIPANGAANVTVNKVTPTITVTPSSTSVYTNASLTISGTVTGPNGNGGYDFVSINGGGYTGGTGLNGSQYSTTIPPEGLTVGTDTIVANFTGDQFFNSASASTTVTVNQWTKVAPTVTVTPASGSIDSGQPLSVQVTVAGADGDPTGTLTLMNGSLLIGTVFLYNGTGGIGSFNVSANQLPAGPATLTANYTGDATYLSASGAATVNVTQSVFTLSSTAASPASIAAGGSVSSIITMGSTTNYNGSASLTCVQTAGPTNITGYAPNCTLSASMVFAGQNTRASVTTVAGSAASLNRPQVFGRGRGLAAGSTILALLFLFGIPSRRRKWRAMLSALVLLTAFATISACGGSGGSSGGGGGTPGTASGSYTFAVTGTGSPAVTPAPSTSFSFTVN